MDHQIHLYEPAAASGQSLLVPHHQPCQQVLTCSQYDEAISNAHKCQPVRSTLSNKWPLGLDLLKKQYDAFNERRLFAFQAQHLAPLDATVAIWLFGQQGWFTTDSKNIEYINATRFEGKSTP